MKGVHCLHNHFLWNKSSNFLSVYIVQEDFVLITLITDQKFESCMDVSFSLIFFFIYLKIPLILEVSLV